MKTFERSFVVAAPLEHVAAFHGDSRALARLTPPPIWVQLHSLEPLAENSRTEFTLWLGPLPVRWVAVHRDVNLRTGFVDAQVSGPFATWEHTHRFEQVDARSTRVTDRIEAKFARRGMNWLVGRLMWLGLPVLFAFRGWRTRRALVAG